MHLPPGYTLGLVEFWAEGSDAGQVMAIEEAPGYPIRNAGDGQGSTNWVASLSVPPSTIRLDWIQIDLGSPRWINRVRWNCDPGMPVPGHCPYAYTIQVSNDGITWGPSIDSGPPDIVLDGNVDVTLEAYGRYIRLSSSAGGGPGWALSALEFWTEGY